MDLVIKHHPVIMSKINIEFNALPLDLKLQESFKYKLKNITNVVTVCGQYAKTHTELLRFSYQARDKDRLSNFLITVTKTLRQLAVLNNGNIFTVHQTQCYQHTTHTLSQAKAVFKQIVGNFLYYVRAIENTLKRLMLTQIYPLAVILPLSFVFDLTIEFVGSPNSLLWGT